MDALSRLVATFILNALWQVPLIAGLALAVDRFLGRAPGRFRHTLWVLALAAAIVVPVASLRPSAMRRSSVTYALGAAVPLREAAPNRLSANFWRAAKSWVKDARQDGIPLPQPWARGLLALYVAFLGVQLIRLGRAWHRARQIGRRASSSGFPARIVTIAEECRGALAAPSGPRTRPIRILASAEIPGPITLGARRPAIVLPNSLLEGESDAELRAALGHELAHVRRRDYLRNLIHELILLPISFHPFAWLIRQRLACTRELACDEMAATLLGRPQYARSLVRMAQDICQFSASSEQELTLGIFDIDILEERVMKLLDPRPLSSTRLAKAMLLTGAVILAACCVAAPKLSVAAAPDASQTSNTTPKAGTITGIVVDSSGARLANASVWLKKRQGSNVFIKTTVTDAAGNFGFAEVSAGHYSLEADFPGKVASYRTITVKPGGWPPFFPFVLESEAAAGGANYHTAGKTIRINGAVEAAKVTSQPPPKYPESAKARRVQGLVRIDAVISAAGVPEKLRVLSSPADVLSNAALEAVRQWRYKTTLLNGRPIAVETEIDVDFNLQR